MDSDGGDETTRAAALFTPNKSNSENRKKERALPVDKTILNEMFYYTVFIVHGNVMIVSHGSV